MPPLELDHLIVAGPDLAALVDQIAALTGVRAVPGGRHAGQGTHNALLGLGPGRYLELLAPDPDGGGGDFRASIAYVAAPALHTWCVRIGGLGGAADAAVGADAIAARVAAAGCTPRRLAMSRRRPDGVTLRWELVFADGHPYGGLVPFFIDWQGSPHPAGALPGGVGVESLRLAHPDAGGLRRLLEALGTLPSGVEVAPSAEPEIAATWLGPAGRSATSGRGGPGPTAAGAPARA